jgi:serine/threonine protein kinase
LGDYAVNLSGFEERSIISESDEVPNGIYHRVEDHCLVVISLCHPCIAAPIDFVFGIESGGRRELKIVRLYLEGCSLLEVVSVNPLWWTSTVKAKAVAGIVLGLRFAHSLGLVHDHLTANSILFDSDHCIQIVDFDPILLENNESANESEYRTQPEGFSEAGWTPEKDIQAFTSILFELVLGHPPQGAASFPTRIPAFVSMIIELGLSARSGTNYSFNTIFTILEQNDFEIEDGVDSAEVSTFVSWVTSAEPPDK